MRIRYLFIITGAFLFVLLARCSHGEKTATLLDDDFRRTRRGLYSFPLGATTEYHYIPEAEPKGRWEVSAFRLSSGSQQAWHIEDLNHDHVLVQKYNNPDEYTHPMVVTGDSLWQDYTVTAWFSPLSDKGQSGIIFRYQNDRCYYFFGVDGSKAILKRVNHGTGFHTPHEEVIAQRLFTWTPGKELIARITVTGSHISAALPNKGVIIEAEDSMFAKGRVALMSDVPTRYHRIRVATTPEAKQVFLKLREKREQEAAERQAANPKPVPWKKLSTRGFGTGLNLRFGDLDGDSDIDVLIGQVVNRGRPKSGLFDLSCLTAMTFDGDILWQAGEPNPQNYTLASDVAFQIHDLDGDGKSEVVYCMNFEIIVADGATGETLYKAPTPDATRLNSEFPEILSDGLFFADIRGAGHPGDIVIKDRYGNFWVLDNHLKTLWNGSGTYCHTPCAYDIDGDSRDEIIIGYTLYDDDGTRLWSLDDAVKDHADGAAIVRFRDDQDVRILFAAGESGLFFTDLASTIVKHHWIGHAQNPAVANFRDDIPGLESLSIDFWGSQGIMTFYNADGEKYYQFEPNQFGSMCLPVNWTGGSEEYFLHNASVRSGGMFDGRGQRAVVFPDDGHPDMCNMVLDITGDCRDELVIWDQHRIWVYTQDDNPKTGRLYNPVRSPQYNYSNYRATVSLPGWSE